MNNLREAGRKLGDVRLPPNRVEILRSLESQSGLFCQRGLAGCTKQRFAQFHTFRHSQPMWLCHHRNRLRWKEPRAPFCRIRVRQVFCGAEKDDALPTRPPGDVSVDQWRPRLFRNRRNPWHRSCRNVCLQWGLPALWRPT